MLAQTGTIRTAACSFALLLGLLLLSGCSAGLKGLSDYRPSPDAWGMFRNSPAGHSNELPDIEEPVTLLWKKEIKGRLYASPAISNGLGVIPALDRKVYLFDPITGDGNGKIKMKSSLSSSPAIAENLLYIASEKNDGRLLCININSGKTVWERGLGDVSAPVILYKRSVLVGNYDGEFFCINRFTGDTNWSYTTDGPVLGGAAAADQRVFVGSSDGRLYCLSYDSGQLLWEFNTGYAILSTPAVGLYCYVGSSDHCMYAVDIQDGYEVWRFQTGGQIFSSPVLDDAAVYFGSNDRCLYSVSHDTGRLLWKFETDAVINSTPLVMSNAVVLGSGDSRVYFVAKFSGKEIESFSTESMIVSSPVYFRSRIYIACTEKRLYCFGAAGSAAAETAATAP